MEGAVYRTLVLVLGLDAQGDGLHEGVDVVEVLEVVGEKLAHPGEYLLHQLLYDLTDCQIQTAKYQKFSPREELLPTANSSMHLI